MRYTTKETAPLLKHLSIMAPDSSKNTLRIWLKHGRIRVDGNIMHAPHIEVPKNAMITLADKPAKMLEEGVQLLFEDAHILVVDKPSGLLSVETPFQKDRTLHAVLKRYTRSRVYPVHRLDRDAKGVMIFATSIEAFQGLKDQFANHSLYREYRARIEGHISPSKGTINKNLIEDRNYTVHVHPDGERAVTHYEVLATHQNTSTLKCVLETGKKNQIRVHLSHTGHPILGDTKYGAINPGALCLLAHTIRFVHPVTEKTMEFCSEKTL